MNYSSLIGQQVRVYPIRPEGGNPSFPVATGILESVFPSFFKLNDVHIEGDSDIRPSMNFDRDDYTVVKPSATAVAAEAAEEAAFMPTNGWTNSAGVFHPFTIGGRRRRGSRRTQRARRTKRGRKSQRKH
jgi:hypothetical protein